MIHSQEEIEKHLEADDILKSIPEISDIKEFVLLARGAKDVPKWMISIHKNIIVYIILIYDKNSFFNARRGSMSLSERKLKAAQLSEIKVTKNIEAKLFHQEDDFVFDLIFAILKAQNSYLWMQIIYTESMLDEYFRIIARPLEIDSDKDLVQAMSNKSKVRVESKEMVKDLQVYYDQFFKEHEDVRTKKRERDSLEKRAKMPG